MSANQETYSYTKNKIKVLKDTYPSLKSRSDETAFSALCIKAVFYKNPALFLYEEDLADMIVDGQYDGGVDAILTDPSSEASDLVICQSKYYTSITAEVVKNALSKMAQFYKDMLQGHYEQVNSAVQRRFLSLNAETGEESKIQFVLFTSAPQSGINRPRMEKIVKDSFPNLANNVEVHLYFDSDVVEAIKESESRRPTVEAGQISIDEKDNYLTYSYGNFDAAIVNASAYSIKTLYAQHGVDLLSRNLRYHINDAKKDRDIDKAINETIQSVPEAFWLRNNGLTITCDYFNIDGKEVKLRNFSIVNGGQTTYMISKSKSIDQTHDLFLPCKIIQVVGDSEDEKNAFSLEIAKATNSQKAIRPSDLKANAPEQVRFCQAMRERGVYYQTKRGDSVPKCFGDVYKHSDLTDIGKLCLAAVFQMPCASRSKPSLLYDSKYYEPVFNGNQEQIAALCEELLYIDYHFRKVFSKKYDKMIEEDPDASAKIPFAHNARTACIAFAAFASRYIKGNITNEDLQTIFAYAQSSSTEDSALYDTFKDIDGYTTILPRELFAQKDKYDEVLDKLFIVLIHAGVTDYSVALRYDSTLTATNFLKRDKSYYRIIQSQWSQIEPQIREIFNGIA